MRGHCFSGRRRGDVEYIGQYEDDIVDLIRLRTAAVRGGARVGWNGIDLPRILGLVALNAIGVHGFDGLPVIAFNKFASA